MHRACVSRHLSQELDGTSFGVEANRRLNIALGDS